MSRGSVSGLNGESLPEFLELLEVFLYVGVVIFEPRDVPGIFRPIGG
jgi:hypothetical protein